MSEASISTIYERENVFIRILIVFFIIALWTHLYVFKSAKDMSPETLGNYMIGYYSTPLIILYCVFEFWRSITYPYKLIIHEKKKRLTKIFFLGEEEVIDYLQLQKYETSKGIIFYILLKNEKKIKLQGRYKSK